MRVKGVLFAKISEDLSVADSTHAGVIIAKAPGTAPMLGSSTFVDYKSPKL
jgi:hypothetical protein